MPQTTDRFALPLLAAGQAQKELTHNEALAMVDMLVQPIVQAVAPASVPVTLLAGQCWIVGLGAMGAWAGHDNALAAYTAGGWRFVPAQIGMSVYSLADSTFAQFIASAWVIGSLSVRKVTVNNCQVIGAQKAAIAAPNGGTIVDSQSRDAISSILGALRGHGLIAS